MRPHPSQGLHFPQHTEGTRNQQPQGAEGWDPGRHFLSTGKQTDAEGRRCRDARILETPTTSHHRHTQGGAPLQSSGGQGQWLQLVEKPGLGGGGVVSRQELQFSRGVEAERRKRDGDWGARDKRKLRGLRAKS